MISIDLSTTERESVKSALATRWPEIMKPLQERITELADSAPL